MASPTTTRSDRGFTLVEILIAIVLVGVLSAVVVVGVSNLTSKGSAAACSTSADAANVGATTYFAGNGAWPTTLAQMTTASPPTLTLPGGVTIDASGVIARGNGWALTVSPDPNGGRPVFVCTGDLPAGFTIGPNGHFYKYVSTPTTWTTAATAARSLTSGSLTGYLVTIGDAAENAFVVGLTTGATVWLGGSDTDTENTWRWLDGPENGQQFWSGKWAASGGVGVLGRYSNWWSVEPNNDGEDCLQLYSNGTWNDLGCASTLGYVIELGGWSLPSCSGLAASVTAAAEAYRSANGSYPTALTPLLSGPSPLLVLPAGITADPEGMAVSSPTYTVGLFPNGSSAPTVVCSDAPPSGWSLGRNGHLYRFLSTTSTWSDAVTSAAGFSQYGRTAHLATISSAVETADAVLALSGATAWMAGSDAATENTWIWTAGPETGTQFWSGKSPASGGLAVGGRYSNWSPSEPNNDSEDCLQIYASGMWNDLTCTNLVGSLLEIEP